MQPLRQSYWKNGTAGATNAREQLMKESSALAPETIKGKAHRYLSYREASTRIKESIEKDYFLEAIAIAESIIADRLNSYLELNAVTVAKPFIPLSARITAVRKLNQAPIVVKGFDDLLGEIGNWNKQRNAVIHGIVSDRAAERESIDKFLIDSKATAEHGSRLARAVDKWISDQKKLFNDSLKGIPENGFRRMQARLRELGWLVEWNLPCCQSCAWDALPDKHEVGPFVGQWVNCSKVLFNHSQDCEYGPTPEERNACKACGGEGWREDVDEPCKECNGQGEHFHFDTTKYDTSVTARHSLAEHNFVCNWPEQQDHSLFCFDGGKKGVQNLSAIIPIIEACGCKVEWNGKSNERPKITWPI